MPDVNDVKRRILACIQRTGPALPVQISREIGMNMIFAGALLSELVSFKQLRISTAKIGGSPLYYMPGQEAQLSRLYEALPQKEKEAYALLKEKRVLRDIALAPAIRVALRELKDFAMPNQCNTGNGGEIVWKWHLADDSELDQVITMRVQQQPSRKEVKPPEQKQLPKNEVNAVVQDTFRDEVCGYMKKNNMSIIEQEVVRKNREVHMHVTLPSSLGDLDFLVTAKNKKRINEADLSLSHHKGQSQKLPVLFLSTGELTKKARAYQEKNLKGYLIFREMK